jgi:hypothetical protein
VLGGHPLPLVTRARAATTDPREKCARAPTAGVSVLPVFTRLTDRQVDGRSHAPVRGTRPPRTGGSRVLSPRIWAECPVFTRLYLSGAICPD